MTRVALAAACLALTALTGCSSSSSEGEPASEPFWGVVPQERTTLAQLRTLQRGGVEAVRIGVQWSLVEAREQGPDEWKDIDEIVANATRADLDVLPYVYGTPGWLAKEETTLPVRTAAQRRAWRSFLRALVGRYGPDGAFWAAHPDLEANPIGTWQIWNEPNFFYFAGRPNPDRYAELVQASHEALASADPGARLLLGGMFALPGERPPLAYPAYRFLELMFNRHPRLRSLVDGVALHPYTRDYRYLPPIVEQVRRALQRVGEPEVGLWVTELGWGSQGGPQASQLETGLRGQARQLRGAFRVLLRNRKRWRLRQIYWFTVTDHHGGANLCNFCDSAGLFTARFRPKPAWRAFVRAVNAPSRSRP
jgi:polysaccharide biosynthesis protein PslG